MQMVTAAFLLANAVGFTLVGVKFIVAGWFLNIPCGFFHYLIIEEPNDAGDPLGTAVICAMPWAQALLTTLVVGGTGVWAVLWCAQEFLLAVGLWLKGEGD